MRELTIHIPDEQLPFFKKLLANLRDVRLVQTRAVAAPAPPAFTPEQQLFVDELKQSLRDAEAFERGELHLQSVDEHLAELRVEAAAGQ